MLAGIHYLYTIIQIFNDSKISNYDQLIDNIYQKNNALRENERGLQPKSNYMQLACQMLYKYEQHEEDRSGGICHFRHGKPTVCFQILNSVAR